VHSFISPFYKQGEDFINAVHGIDSLGIVLQATWTKLKNPLIAETKLYEHYLVRMFKYISTRPAKVLGLHKNRGHISVGCLADIIVWSPEIPDQTISNNSYAGRRLYGQVAKVYLRG
jgi:dihydroorotase-like cyclic amidohydrolase